jgi:hypothetical protein
VLWSLASIGSGVCLRCWLGVQFVLYRDTLPARFHLWASSRLRGMTWKSFCAVFIPELDELMGWRISLRDVSSEEPARAPEKAG